MRIAVLPVGAPTPRVFPLASRRHVSYATRVAVPFRRGGFSAGVGGGAGASRQPRSSPPPSQSVNQFEVTAARASCCAPRVVLGIRIRRARGTPKPRAEATTGDAVHARAGAHRRAQSRRHGTTSIHPNDRRARGGTARTSPLSMDRGADAAKARSRSRPPRHPRTPGAASARTGGHAAPAPPARGAPGL